MDNVVDFLDQKYTTFAEKFVDLYLSEGPETAGEWALDKITPDEYKSARKYVTAEFDKRGYEV